MLTNGSPNGDHQTGDRPLQDGAGRTVALVTGGAEASAWRSHGVSVEWARSWPFHRPTQRLEYRQQLAADNVHALAVTADVTRASEVSAAIERVHTELGPIDILVNSAGLDPFGAFHERSELEWNTVLDTNLKSVFLMSRAVAPEIFAGVTGTSSTSAPWPAKTPSQRHPLLRIKMGTHRPHQLHG